MKRRVPVVFNDVDSVIHRRDPRAKLLVFAMLMAMLYLTPTWQWMGLLALLGGALVVVAKVPKFWVGVLFALQIPQMVSFVVFPAVMNVVAGRPPLAGDFDFVLKVMLSWPAALFVSASLFTSMQLTEITDGLRGLGVPEVAVFTFEYVILLFYLSISDFYRILDAAKLRGVNVETRNPVALVRALPRLALPMFFTVLRRSNTMMAVMRMRGYDFTGEGRELRTDFSFDAGDAAFLAAGLLVVGVTAAARVGLAAPRLPAAALPF